MTVKSVFGNISEASQHAAFGREARYSWGEAALRGEEERNLLIQYSLSLALQTGLPLNVSRGRSRLSFPTAPSASLGLNSSRIPDIPSPTLQDISEYGSLREGENLKIIPSTGRNAWLAANLTRPTCVLTVS
jgi:hypothetical protein